MATTLFVMIGVAAFAVFLWASIRETPGRIRWLPQRRRSSDAGLAQRWDAMEQQRAATPDAGLIGIVNVYQPAKTGTKAVIMWLETGREQDAWFLDTWPAMGSVALVRGGSGWGPHNTNPEVFNVRPEQILHILPPGTPDAVARHRARKRELLRRPSLR